MFPGRFCIAHKLLLRFCRKPIAATAAASTLEFLSVKKHNLIPKIICRFRIPVSYSVINPMAQSLPGLGARNAIRLQTNMGLKSDCCLRGQFPPYSVNGTLVEIQKCQQKLNFPDRHDDPSFPGMVRLHAQQSALQKV
jgi:hypothetical protein